MNKRTILASVLALTMIGAAFSAFSLTGCGCSGKSRKAGKQTVSEVGTKTFSSTDLVSVCSSWPGQLASGIGMTAEYSVTEGSEQRIKLNGKAFDKEAEGYAKLSSGSDVISRIVITSKELTYDEAKKGMTDLFKDPIKEGENECQFRVHSNTGKVTTNGDTVVIEIW